MVRKHSYGTVGGPNDDKKYKSRVIYNSKVNKAMVEASLACKGKRFEPLIEKPFVKSRVFASKNKFSSAITESEKYSEIAVSSPVVSISEDTNKNLLPQRHGVVEDSVRERQVGSPRRRVCMNTASASSVDTSQQFNLQTCPVYDINLAGIEDKFTSALYNAGIQGVKCQDQNNSLFKQWQDQSQFQFGFIPLDEQIMPDTSVVNCSDGLSPFNIHALVRATNKPNYMEARLPVKSQLNVCEWKSRLTNYWDQQLLQLLEFGFPLDFNRNCPLRCEGTNHSSAVDYPSDVDAYIN